MATNKQTTPLNEQDMAQISELADLVVDAEQTESVKGGGEAARLNCSNNLKQIGLALHN